MPIHEENFTHFYEEYNKPKTREELPKGHFMDDGNYLAIENQKTWDNGDFFTGLVLYMRKNLHFVRRSVFGDNRGEYLEGDERQQLLDSINSSVEFLQLSTEFRYRIDEMLFGKKRARKKSSPTHLFHISSHGLRMSDDLEMVA